MFFFFFVSYMRRSAKILNLNKEGITEKNSYERRAYVSLDEYSLSEAMKNNEKIKELMHLRVNTDIIHLLCIS